MDSSRNANIVIGVLLLLAGAWFLAIQFVPELAQRVQIDLEWPLIIVSVGVVFLLLSVLLRSPGLAVPAAIVAGVGGIFYYQNHSQDWASWSYAWTLIPGFVGVGLLLKNLLEGRIIQAFREALPPIFFSAVMFIFFSGIFGGPGLLFRLWPLFLIGAGVSMLARSWRRRPREAAPEVIEQ